MIRNTLRLAGVLVIGGFSLLSAGDAMAQDSFAWKVGTTHPQASPTFKALEDLSSKVDAMSAGRLTIEVFPAGAIVPAAETYPSMVSGVFDAAMFYGTWIEGRNSAWLLSNHTPFGFEDRDAIQMWYLTEGGLEQVSSLSKGDDIKLELFVAQGMEMGMFCREPIKSLADLEGKKLRIGGGPHIPIFNALGVETLALSYEETYSGLERGVVDCAEWDTPFTNYFAKLHEVGPYLLYPAWWQPSATALLGTRQKSYDALPDDLKAIWDVAVREVGLEWSLRSKALDIEHMKKIVAELEGIYSFPPEDMARLREIAPEQLKAYSDANPDFKAIFEDQQEFRERYNEYPFLFKFPN